MLIRLMRYLNRRKTRVEFPSVSTTEPVSRVFGLDRGTPVNRRYIEKFLAQKAGLIRGRVLEVADREYTGRFGGSRVERSEILHAAPGNASATVVGDLTDPGSLPAEAFDCFVCTQTFDCIYDVRKAAEGAHRLLRPGGVLLATMCGISQISRYDMDRWGDFWRFTTASAARLFEPLFAGGVEVESFGNVLAATALLQGLAVEDLPDPSLLDVHDPDYQVIVAVAARKA